VPFLKVLILTGFSTLLTFLEPSVNAFVLMTLGIPSSVLLMYNLRREDEARSGINLIMTTFRYFDQFSAKQI
jgi:hypothetical protein